MSGAAVLDTRCPPPARRAFAAALALLVAGCAAAPDAAPPAATVHPAGASPAVKAQPNVPPAPAAAVPRSPFTAPSPKWIANRITELEATRKKGKGADPDGALALELALLYSHPVNPAPDYAKALAMLRAYLAVAPPGSRDPLLGHIASMLEDIDAFGRIARDSRAREKELAGTVQTLEQRLTAADQREAAAQQREQELLAQIKTLQERIGQLQQLDLEMEKRRRSVR